MWEREVVRETHREIGAEELATGGGQGVGCDKRRYLVGEKEVISETHPEIGAEGFAK